MTSNRYEHFDLSGSRPKETRDLGDRLDRWLSETDADMPRLDAKFDAEDPAAFDREFPWHFALAGQHYQEQNLFRSRVSN